MPLHAFLSCKDFLINVFQGSIIVAFSVSISLEGWKRCIKHVRYVTRCSSFSHHTGREGYSVMPESVLL